MRVAIFGRYSSRLQDELSLDAQVFEMERHCQTQGWTITHRFLLPETRSADVERSEEFQSMLRAAKAREFDCLLVHKLDRFGRNRETSVVHKAALRRMGVQVRSVVENLGDGILDRVMEGMLEVFAEFYSHNLAQETRKGQGQAVRRGLWRGGAVPWGLRKVAVQEAGKTHWGLEVDPVTGPVMREVYERVARGEKTGDVVDWVQARTGEAWSRPTFYTRLRNPVYYGLIQYGRTTMPAGHKRRKADPEALVEGRWEGLVPEELWRAANGAVDDRGRGLRASHRGGNRQTYLLSDGVAFCAACGKPLIGSRMFGQGYYVCPGRRDKVCTRRHVKAEDLERAFFSLVSHEIAGVDIDRVIQEFERGRAPEVEAAQKREKALRRQLDQVRKKMRNLTLAIAEGGDFGSLREMLGQLHGEERALQDEVEAIRETVTRTHQVDAMLLREHLRNLAQALPELEPEELRVVYRDLFELRFDLEARSGSLHMKLQGPRPQPVAPEEEGVRGDLLRATSGRSAPTIRCPEILAFWMPGRGHQVRCLSRTA